MSDSSRRVGAALALIAAVAVTDGCRHAAPPIAPPPPLPPQQLADPAMVSPATRTEVRALSVDTAREMHVDIDTHNREEDVRPLLDFVARQGGFTLVFPSNITRRVRVSLNDVPASVALETLLSLAGLQLETSTPGAKPSTRPVVFYELPVNVDSLSVDGIMKRFGVGRSIAELIVKSRTRP